MVGSSAIGYMVLAMKSLGYSNRKIVEVAVKMCLEMKIVSEEEASKEYYTL